MRKSVIPVVFIFVLLAGCHQRQKVIFDVDDQLEYCVSQATITLNEIPQGDSLIPRNIGPRERDWNFVKYTDWTSGFWAGALWYLYEYTNDPKWERAADQYSSYLEPLSRMSAIDHDLGFQVYNSFGNGYRLTQNPEYKPVILKAADTLATLFNPNVGTILSWPRPVENMEWPQHNTIMDNMINLELLFWASKNGGDKALYNIAVSHAETTMENHFRDDFTCYHVIVYNKETGEKIKGVTHQGFSDESTWARGQAWAIYGYTMVYRETKDPRFLEFAQKVTRPYLDRLPADLIPYWDFDAPNIPNEARDASAAAVVASALLELAQHSEPSLKKEYLEKAQLMLEELSSQRYQCGTEKPAFLMHSTGHHPNDSEVDYSIIYADYYYIEALTRLRRLREDKGGI